MFSSSGTLLWFPHFLFLETAIQGLGLKVWVKGLRVRDRGFKFKISGVVTGIWGLRGRVYGVGVWDLRLRLPHRTPHKTE